MKVKYIIRASLLSFLFISILNSIAYSAILDNWKNSNTYKPNPILFLHGFGSGSSDSWNYIKSALNEYLEDYSTTLTFLETINFDDPNGSVDTYDPGKLNPQGNSDGWTDKLEDRVWEYINIPS